MAVHPEVQTQLIKIVAKCAALEVRLKQLEDRIGVLEDVTVTQYNRLQEIEEADDKIDS